MAIKSTAPEIKYFNPASLVYYNSRGEMTMDLDARLSWFHHEKPGWKITIDGTRIFGMEVYVNNDYEDPDNPNELLTAREKEIQYVAVGFISMLDELDDGTKINEINVIHDRIATKACKAAVKGNMHITYTEAEELFRELLSLDNPYNCPHGRPTIIEMTKTEIEKKFKRII